MLKLGILSPSEIAGRRFLPAIAKRPDIIFAGVAIPDRDEWSNASGLSAELDAILAGERLKAEKMTATYGGKIYNGYKTLIQSGEVDILYIPLPPALHYLWAKSALENSMHVLLEKPFAANLAQANELVSIARQRKVAVHENYAFLYHGQIREIDDIVASGALGHVYLYRLEFGFPRRPANDFRYSPELGGGAFMDCGGYPVRYAEHLLGQNIRIKTATLTKIRDFNVDIFGAGTFCNDQCTAHIAFGMDNDYRCDINIWGSKGSLESKRIYTAPDAFEATCTILRNGKQEVVSLHADDSFLASFDMMVKCINESDTRNKNYNDILLHAKLMDDFARIAAE